MTVLLFAVAGVAVLVAVLIVDTITYTPAGDLVPYTNGTGARLYRSGDLR